MKLFGLDKVSFVLLSYYILHSLSSHSTFPLFPYLLNILYRMCTLFRKILRLCLTRSSSFPSPKRHDFPWVKKGGNVLLELVGKVLSPFVYSFCNILFFILNFILQFIEFYTFSLYLKFLYVYMQRCKMCIQNVNIL